VCCCAFLVEALGWAAFVADMRGAAKGRASIQAGREAGRSDTWHTWLIRMRSKRSSRVGNAGCFFLFSSRASVHEFCVNCGLARLGSPVCPENSFARMAVSFVHHVCGARQFVHCFCVCAAEKAGGKGRGGCRRLVRVE